MRSEPIFKVATEIAHHPRIIAARIASDWGNSSPVTFHLPRDKNQFIESVEDLIEESRLIDNPILTLTIFEQCDLSAGKVATRACQAHFMNGLVVFDSADEPGAITARNPDIMIRRLGLLRFPTSRKRYPAAISRIC